MVIDYFRKISEVPRGSRNNKEISDFLVAFAKDKNLKYIQDEALNVIIFKDGSAGYENMAPLIMQGHMDMVCEKVSAQCHDFFSEGLKLCVDDGFMYAEDTTLGADDGIAVAYMLEFLADDNLVHPPFEMIFTTDEEIGMLGASALDVSCLKGKHMINLDSEEEGIFLASCAGGMTGTILLDMTRSKCSGLPVTIELKGLKGGHSGTDIDKNRSNALLLLGRLLAYLPKHDFEVLSVNGGGKDNVIPNEAILELVVKTDNFDDFVRALTEKASLLINELTVAEPNITFNIDTGDNKVVSDYEVLDDESFAKVFFLLNYIPNGVQVMSSDIDGMVESSSNLGIFSMEEAKAKAVISMRSSKRSYIEYISMKLAGIAAMLDCRYETNGSYPGWTMKAKSTFRDMLCKVYKDVTGKVPVVSSIHAGLECGVLSDKIPDLDIVSMGPDVYDIHTVKEKMSLASVDRMYNFLKEAIETFAKEYK